MTRPAPSRTRVPTRWPRLWRTHLAAASLCLASLLGACGEKPEALLTSARQYLQKEDYKAAIIQIKNALQSQPNLPEARFLLGRALLDSGDASGAETELRRALALQHPREAVVPVLARALLAQNLSARLIEEFANQPLQTAEARADLQLSLARAYALQDDTEHSESSLQAALQTAPGMAAARLERARRLAAKGDVPGAQTLLDALIAEAPQSFEAWKLRGDLYRQTQGHSDDALAAYRKAVAIKPDYLAGQSALMLMLLQQAQLDAATQQLAPLQKIAPNHPYTHYLAALLAYQKKDYAGASELVQRSLRAMPGNAAALELAGACELQLQRLPQAQAYLGRALEIAPNLAMARRLLVASYLRQQQPAKARDALLPGLAQEPVDQGLFALAGEVFFRNGEMARAEEFFSKARAKNPNDSRLKTSLAMVGMAQGPAAPALETLRDIAATDSGASADMALISSLLQRKDYEQALQAIAKLEKKQPTQPVAPYLRARVQMATQQGGKARESLQRALALDATYFPAVASLASLDLADKKPVEARKRIEAYLQKQPRHAQALLALADIAAQGGASVAEVGKLLANAVAANPTHVDTRLLLVDLYLGHKDYKSAVAAAQSAVAALPDDARIVDALGRSLQAAGDTNQALASYQRLIELMPKSALPWWRMADTQLLLRDQKAAIQSLQQALALQPDFLDGQRALVALYVANQQPDMALDIARTVQKQRPKEETGYAMEADILASTQNWDQASAALRAGMKTVPTTPLAMKLHTALQAAGKAAEATQFAAQWLKDHPQDAGFLFYLGDQAMVRRDYSSAEQHYAAVLKQQPDNPVVLNNLAYVSGKLKKDGALALAERAVALAPRQATFIDTLANLHADNGNYARAVELQTQAVALQPQNPLFKLDLAIMHLRAGKKELARKSLDELSALGDRFAEQAQVQALQKELARP